MAEPGFLEAGMGADKGVGWRDEGDNTQPLDLITSIFLMLPVLKLQFR